MLLLIILFCILCHGCTSSSSKPVKAETRIIGGTSASIKQSPYLAQFCLNGFMICGASIISPLYAVTAAHCTVNNGAYAVRTGTSLLDKGGVVTKVRLIYVHPKYNKFTSVYDIAILYLAAPLKFSDVMKPVKLPSDNRYLRPGRLGTVSGWGTIDPNADILAKVLQQVQLPVVDINVCMMRYFWSIDTKTILCAGYPQGQKDACRGDSGGPFVIDGVLVGIVSWGIGCAEPGYPGVYTNVASVRSYIREKTGI